MRRSVQVILPIIVLCCALHAILYYIGTTGEDGAQYALQLRQYLMFQPPALIFHGFLPFWQTAWMFFTYSFVHVGISHLGANMVFLAIFGYFVMQKADQAGFLIIYLASMIAGALAFLLTDPYTPMVGASGAIYGLAGALIYWNWRERAGGLKRYLWLLSDAFFMLSGNVLYYIVGDGDIAWQAHVGGCVAGFIYAALQEPKSLPSA